MAHDPLGPGWWIALTDDVVWAESETGKRHLARLGMNAQSDPCAVTSRASVGSGDLFIKARRFSRRITAKTALACMFNGGTRLRQTSRQ